MHVKYDMGQPKLLELRISSSIHGVQAPSGDSSGRSVAAHRAAASLLVAAVNAVLWRSARDPARCRQ